MSLKRPKIQTNLHSEENFVTAKEAANYIQTTRQRIYNLTYLKVIPYYKFGKKVLFKKSDLKELVVKVDVRNDLWKRMRASQVPKANFYIQPLLDRRRKQYKRKL